VLRGVSEFESLETHLDLVVLNTVDDGASHAVSRARERSRSGFRRECSRATPFEPGSRDSEWCDFAKFSTIYFLPNEAPAPRSSRAAMSDVDASLHDAERESPARCNHHAISVSFASTVVVADVMK